jgi:hypothetical protein
MLAAVLITSLGVANFIANPNFDAGLDGWSLNTTAVPIAADTFDGRTCAKIEAAPDVPIGFYGLYQEFPAHPGRVYQAAFDGHGENTRDGRGVYGALEFYEAGGRRLGFIQTDPVTVDGVWRRVSVRGRAPEDAVRVRLVILIHGHGTARFDNALLTESTVNPLEPDAPGETVTLRVSAQPLPVRFLGIGAEDDGWFYNAENAAHGVTEADYALREARIAWMDPDFIRMFFWYKDWCPSGDWETFTWDSDNMRSHYRTLELYQRIGASVAVCGVEWGMPAVFDDPEGLARGWGVLLEHLIRERGLTCVRYWTLTNEPNTHWDRLGKTFEDYVRIHELVKEELDRRGLDVAILGSDDTAGLDWFAQCANEPRYRAVTDVLVSHRYFPWLDQDKVPAFYDERLKLAREIPFAVMEFGFQDERSGTLENPLMETYPYAIWAMNFAIEGLNRGTVAFAIWCLHETYYPGNGFMNYGLWNYKGDGWRVRPVYHAWSALTRRTKTGDPTYAVVSSHPDHVKAVRVGETLFLTNQSTGEAQVRLEGWSASTLRTMQESQLAGDRLCGAVEPLENNTFALPPRSFGYAFSGMD